MPLFRPVALTALCACALSLSGCGKDASGGNVVAMKDLEVADGTASDAMTDLDGVQTQGTATVPTGDGNSANAAAAPKAAANASTAATNSSAEEAVPDQ